VGLDFAGVAESFEAGGDGGFVDQNGLFVEVFKCGVNLVRLGSDGEGTPSEKEKSTKEASAVMGEYVGDAEGLDAPFEEGWNVGVLENGIQGLRDFGPWGGDLIVAGVSLRVGEESGVAEGGGSGVLGVGHGVVSFLWGFRKRGSRVSSRWVGGGRSRRHRGRSRGHFQRPRRGPLG
jgi:hypothetical protein